MLSSKDYTTLKHMQNIIQLFNPSHSALLVPIVAYGFMWNIFNNMQHVPVRANWMWITVSDGITTIVTRPTSFIAPLKAFHVMIKETTCA